jgi:oligoribonuclease NrnB/cAMP/cGMP phosphodiesterase (DHH superfamily)
MKTLKDKVNYIVNEYLKFQDNCEKNNIEDATTEYDEQYKIWLTETTKELSEKLRSDILPLCEVSA